MTQTTKKTTRKPMSKASAIARILSLAPCINGRRYMEESKAKTFGGLFAKAAPGMKVWLAEELAADGTLKPPRSFKSKLPANNECHCGTCVWQEYTRATGVKPQVRAIEKALRKIKPLPAIRVKELRAAASTYTTNVGEW